MNDYAAFLDYKLHYQEDSGFSDCQLPDFLFGFQRALTGWALQKGRAAIFADCGLGKTPMQLVWAENVVRKTGGRVLILTPLAVSAQTIREGEKFGIDVTRSRDGTAYPGITITNYEQLSKFNAADFVGVVCDESSILKSFSGVRRHEITMFMRKIPYRLLCTATAAPNDHIELGTSSEALGYLGYMDVLNRFFKNEQNNSATRRAYGKASQWRFKGHAEEPFWKWVSSWARATRRPSDLGCDDDGFVLPPLIENEHLVEARSLPDGMLFDLPAVDLREQRAELRRTIHERCERVAELIEHDKPVLVWCHLNDEGDLLERLIPDAIQVAGKDSDDAKEEKLLGFADGDVRVLVTKPKIGAWGLNFQHCAHVTFFPSHSFEQYYQAVRRCWRFGQERPVVVDIVTTEGQRKVLANLRAKAVAADRMFTRLVAHMKEALTIDGGRTFTHREEIPSWL
jgi:hypothetical protein